MTIRVSEEQGFTGTGSRNLTTLVNPTKSLGVPLLWRLSLWRTVRLRDEETPVHDGAVKALQQVCGPTSAPVRLILRGSGAYYNL